MQTGREAPCPCGSGRKFKHCCFGEKAPPAHPRQPRRSGRGIPAAATSSMPDDQESASSAAIRGLLVDFCGRFLTYDVTTRVFRLCDRLDLGAEFSLSRGRPGIWAAAIAYAIAQVNALFDAHAPLGVAAAEIHAFFGTNPDTVRRKARRLRQALGIAAGHPDYCRAEIAAAQIPASAFAPDSKISGDAPCGGEATAAAPPSPSPPGRSRRTNAAKRVSRIGIPGRQMRLFDD